MAMPHVNALAGVVAVTSGIDTSTVVSARIPRGVPVLNRRSAVSGLLSQQQGTNQWTRADGPKKGTGGTRAHLLRPPEPASQQRGDRRCHERTHNQRVE